MEPRIQFMNAPSGGWSRSATVVKRSDGGLFWWSIGITLLIGVATFSWFFCIYAFTHPEKPFYYNLLHRFEKLEPLRAFTEKDMPVGKTSGYKDLYQTFYPLAGEHLAQKNSELHRAYITNYKQERPLYLRGSFKVTHSRPLTNDDVFTRGTVARAVALVGEDHEYRNVVIEYILPSRKQPKDHLLPGDVIKLDTPDQAGKGRRYASLLNVDRRDDDGMIFTVVPLAYGEHANPQAGVSIKAEPPDVLNMAGKWPITDDAVGASMDVAVAR
jgi:hypothetical protein